MEKDFNIRNRLFGHIDDGFGSSDPAAVESVKYSMDMLDEMLANKRRPDLRINTRYLSDEFFCQPDSEATHKKRIIAIGGITKNMVNIVINKDFIES